MDKNARMTTFHVGDKVRTTRGTGRVVEVKSGKKETLVLVLYAPLMRPVWHDARYVMPAYFGLSDLHVGDIVEFPNGDRATITGLELTDGNERVRVTRYNPQKGNLTVWMKWATFRDKGPVMVLCQQASL